MNGYPPGYVEKKEYNLHQKMIGTKSLNMVLQFHENLQKKNFFLNFRLNFKLVLAEPLDNSKGSHVQTFLDQHGGPGLQHIGLTTANASITVQVMSDQGAQFRKPPPTYYQLVSTNYFYFQLYA